MSNKKVTKRALLTSILAICMCLVMLVGSTFAWFTDTASTSVNRIESGKLDVQLWKATADEDLGTEPLQWVKAKGHENEQVLWEPNATYNLAGFRIHNNGNLALKYKIVINGVVGSAKLLEAIDFSVSVGEPKLAAKDETAGTTIASLADLNGFEGKLAAGDTTGVITLTGKMKDTAGNEFQGLSADGISITVLAAQDTVEYDSFNNTYDENAEYDESAIPGAVANYSLAEFNALDAIPEDVGTVYVDLGGASLQGGLTIGNANIADHYHYGEWNSTEVPEGYPADTGRTDTRTSDGAVRHIYSTGKKAVNVILTGSVTGAADTGNFNAGTIVLKVPDAAKVTFNKVTFGAGQMAVKAWTESGVQSMTVDHRIAGVTFNGCTFNGNWIQNGYLGAGTMSILNCTFNNYENTASQNNSNPIWIQNLGQCNVTITGSEFNAARPIKLWEGVASGTVTIKDNTFNMSNFAGATGTDAYKNVAIMFCQSTLDTVEVTGNTVTGNATGFVCFYDNTDHYPTMNSGATFTLSGNTLPTGTPVSVLWKSTTEWAPTYVQQ